MAIDQPGKVDLSEGRLGSFYQQGNDLTGLDLLDLGANGMAQIGAHGNNSLPAGGHPPTFQQFPGIDIEKRTATDDQIRRTSCFPASLELRSQ